MQNKFFAEFLQRLFKKNPEFFDYIQAGAAAVAGLGALFAYLHQYDITLPNWLQWIECKETIISGVVTFIVAQLPNKDVNQPNK